MSPVDVDGICIPFPIYSWFLLDGPRSKVLPPGMYPLRNYTAATQ